ncbi:methyltransferase [Nesterenkonia lutea]|uniref:Release factor glutamine methyltransferase/ribosomal protein L3 glutamine methyltransferase n=1 Tax=Nesterenkonia lutea TaxID=272919 RepID=A0ABR9JHJ0_9MICC|nr:class I SAM-dependent methyltransferase [Nesterenkonia lutea]MBE1525385.1 release factor glutamine methyltransferase/ribosomal protein L3 glutamine methyltransferase [Nesterenkonia lutea]
MKQLTFRGLAISFDDRVLEPRPWTEAQSAWAAELLIEAPPGPVLELCAGVGHIGLGAMRDSDRRLVMVDVNPVAEQFAQENAAANGLGSEVEFRLSRIDTALAAEERFSLIVADPPWVRSAETSMFPEDPILAIDGGDDGLVLARTCVDLMDRHLSAGGSGLLQLGNTAQAETIAGYAAEALSGSVRVVETRVFERGVLVRMTR